MADDKGYYVFWGCPTELKTDQKYTYQMSTTGGDMTDVTYEFRWEFTCDGVTTKETIASGLTSLTYTWTATSVKFGPLMKKSKSGTLKLIVATSTGKMTYSKVLPLTISDSVKLTISGVTITRTNGFNNRSVSNVTSHKLSFNVAGLYGASQSVTVSVGANNYTKSVNAVAGNAVTKVEFDIGAFDAGTSDIYVKAISIHVADSRSNIADTSTSIDIYKYVRPTVEASVYRNANEEAYIAFTPTIQTTVAGKANSTSLFYARSILGESAVQTDLKTSPQKLNGADDVGKSYSVFVFLKDAVGGIAVARLVLPSNVPVMDIGSDGKTVTFFGTSPTTADKESLVIGKLASFGEKARIGYEDSAYTLIGSNGYSFYNASSGNRLVHIGVTSEYVYENEDDVWMTLGLNNSASVFSLAIGGNNDAHRCSCAIGYNNEARGCGCAIGANCIVSESAGADIDGETGTLAAGVGVESYREGQCVFGTYNVVENGAPDIETFERQIFIIGNGTSDTNRSSAFIVYEDGHARINNSFQVYDSSGKLGVQMYRDSEGGEIRIYAPNAKAFWFMDAFDYNLRFGYNGGSSYSDNFTQITTDGRLVLSNVINGTGGYFSSNIFANKFASNNDYTKAFSVYCQWKDGANHDLLLRNSDGLYAAVGWAGSSSYKTTIRLRGQTCQYANASGTTTLSDERLKDDFQSLDKWEGFFDNLEPCAFKLKNGSSGRYHFGFKAQQVKESLEKAGLTTKDFAGFVTTKYDVDEDDPETTELYEQLGIKPGDDVHGLIYTEFVALQHNEIQKLKERVKNLETEIKALKQ